MTAPSLMEELEEVVRLFGKLPDAGRVSFAMYGDAMRAEMAASTFIRAHHAEIADMAKRLEAADALLRRCFVYSPEFVEVSPWTLQHDIQQHLKGAGDEVDRRTPEKAE